MKSVPTNFLVRSAAKKHFNLHGKRVSKEAIETINLAILSLMDLAIHTSKHFKTIKKCEVEHAFRQIGKNILSIFFAVVLTGQASWYSQEACKFNPDPVCPTASGRSLYALEEKGEYFAAMWDVPFGTRFKVTNKENGKSVVVSIQDRGPARRLNRVIDLGRDAFKEIADERVGLINVEVRPV